jgi:hypothetical protein
MEREILAGINYELYVDKTTYDGWVILLKGLVLAKEKDLRSFNRSRQSRQTPLTRQEPVAPLAHSRRSHVASPRARSSSPVRHQPLLSAQTTYTSAASNTHSPPRPHSKRTATDAFSPTSTSFNIERPPPAKRPVSLALEIPQSASRSLHTPSPLESLPFSKLSIATSSPATRQPKSVHELTPLTSRRISPRTLVTAYRLDPTKPRPTPQVRRIFTHS